MRMGCTWSLQARQMVACRSIDAMDCANSDKVVAMGKQIYEMFQHNVVTDVSIMKPTSVGRLRADTGCV